MGIDAGAGAAHADTCKVVVGVTTCKAVGEIAIKVAAAAITAAEHCVFDLCPGGNIFVRRGGVVEY